MMPPRWWPLLWFWGLGSSSRGLLLEDLTFAFAPSASSSSLSLSSLLLLLLTPSPYTNTPQHTATQQQQPQQAARSHGRHRPRADGHYDDDRGCRRRRVGARVDNGAAPARAGAAARGGGGGGCAGGGGRGGGGGWQGPCGVRAADGAFLLCPPPSVGLSVHACRRRKEPLLPLCSVCALPSFTPHVGTPSPSPSPHTHTHDTQTHTITLTQSSVFKIIKRAVGESVQVGKEAKVRTCVCCVCVSRVCAGMGGCGWWVGRNE